MILNDAALPSALPLILGTTSSGPTTLDISATGSNESSGSADITIPGATPTSLEATGSNSPDGSAILQIVGSVSATGANTPSGSADFVIVLGVTATGSNVSAGDATLSMVMTVAATGTNVSSGDADLILFATVSATGSNAPTGSASITIWLDPGPAIVGEYASGGDYRVVIADMSGVELEEVPFKNLQFSFALNDAGSCSFSLPIEHPKCTKDILWPGKREVHVVRNGVRVWGGYLWSAFPNTGDKEMRFASEGWFSRLSRRFIDADHFKVDTEQLDIAWSLINFTQSKTDGDLGITRFNPAEDSGVIRTRKYHEWERYNIADELIALTEVNNGFDFEITANKEWKTYYPQKGAVTDIVFDLNKNIGTLDLQIDASDLISEFTAMGAGERRNRCIITVADASVRAEFGLLQGSDSFSRVKHYDTLADKATDQLDLYKTLRRTPQLSVVTDEPVFSDYVVGDRVRVRAEYGNYIDIDELFRVTAISMQLADSGRESQTVFLEEPVA